MVVLLSINAATVPRKIWLSTGVSLNREHDKGVHNCTVIH